MKKEIQYSSLHTTLFRIVKGLDITHPELGKALRKWHPFIFQAVINTAKITNSSEEDVLSDILLGFAQVNDICSEPLFRYRKRLYKIVAEDGDSILVESKCKDRVRFWISRINLEEVKCAKTESLLYKKIQQRCIEVIRLSNAQKRRGEHVDIGCLDYVGELSLMENITPFNDTKELMDYVINFQCNPEQIFSTIQIIDGLAKYISKDALIVLEDCVDHPGTSFISSAKRLGISRRKVRAARLEILRIFSYLEQARVKVIDKQPIYIRADQLC